MSKTAEEILAHPRFAEARRAHIDALVGLFADNRFVTRLMIDSGTIMLRALLVGFHVAHDEDDRTTWATLGQVQNVLVERGLASARRVEDLVARFRQVGYVVSVESPSDIRVRILKPTEQLLAHDRDHLAVYHRFLYDLYPDRGHDWTLRQDPRVHFAIRKAMFLALDKATVFTRHQPIMTFLSRNAGYCAFLLVAQAALSRYPREQSFGSIADRLGVSRTHVRNIFVDAEAAGFVSCEGKPGSPVEILPPLWQAYDDFLADMQAGQDAIAQAAFDKLFRKKRAGIAVIKRAVDMGRGY